MNRLKDRSGETLAEVLVSVLLMALALLILASLETAAGRILQAARIRDGETAQILQEAEQCVPGSGQRGTVIWQEAGPDGGGAGGAFRKETPVEFYGRPGLWSWAPRTEGP